MSAVRSIYDARIMGDGAGSVVSGDEDVRQADNWRWAGSVVSGDMDERRGGSVVSGDKEILFAANCRS